MLDINGFRSKHTNESFSDEMLLADKKIEYMQSALTSISKRLPSVSSGSSDFIDFEKKIKKIPEHALGVAMCEAASNDDDDDSIIKYIFEDCGE